MNKGKIIRISGPVIDVEFEILLLNIITDDSISLVISIFSVATHSFLPCNK